MMNIDRHNYEEYFILYMDNELDSDARLKVEDFVQRNPDLKEELDTMMQFKLAPDTEIVFENKSQLIRQQEESPVNLANYEEWFILYMDDELTASERISVEQFISSYPQIKTEFFLFLQTRMQPEAIVFPAKESLLRKEEKVRRLPWWKIAAAAVLILAAGTFAFRMINNQRSATPPEQILTKSPIDKNNQGIQAPVTNVGEEEKFALAPGDVITKQQSTEKTPMVQSTVENNMAVQKKKYRNTIDPDKIQSTSLKEEKQNDLIANRQPLSNQLPAPLNNPNVEKINTDIARKNTPVIKQDVKELNTVTTDTPVASDTYTYASNNNDDADLNQPGDKKNKLRGLLRKVTRTFEKTTNINATDDQDRVLIGGLAIKLK
jgi:hypothetical protein